MRTTTDTILAAFNDSWEVDEGRSWSKQPGKGDTDNAQHIPAAIIGLWSHVSGTIRSVIFGPEPSTVDQQRGTGRTGPQVVTREARAILLHWG
jgi:hypothetical protein